MLSIENLLEPEVAVAAAAVTLLGSPRVGPRVRRALVGGAVQVIGRAEALGGAAARLRRRLSPASAQDGLEDIFEAAPRSTPRHARRDRVAGGAE